MPARSRTPDSVSVLGKISSVLEAIAARDQMSAAELAEQLDEPRSSVHRMLRQLHEIGWIEPGGSRGQWCIALQLFRLGSSAVHRMDVRRAALPHMQHLHDVSGETVFLVIAHEMKAVCVERIEGRRVQSIALTLGASTPLHAGAGPLALLAWADDERHRAWLVHAAENGLEQMNLDRQPTVSQIETQLREIRERGYAISDQDVTVGIGALGAPVFDYRGRLVAAVSVSGITETIFDPRTALPERVMEAARRTSFELGYREPGGAVRPQSRSAG